MRPAFKKIKASLDQYDVIYLGYPNWWNSHPRLINTFIEAYGLKGKTVIPFMTSGGSDIKNSVKNLRKDYPEVNWEDGKLLNGATQEEVDAWEEINRLIICDRPYECVEIVALETLYCHYSTLLPLLHNSRLRNDYII